MPTGERSGKGPEDHELPESGFNFPWDAEPSNKWKIQYCNIPASLFKFVKHSLSSDALFQLDCYYNYQPGRQGWTASDRRSRELEGTDDSRREIILPWDSEPVDKWRVQFDYDSVREWISGEWADAEEAEDSDYVAPEGGGFQYGECPKIFLGRKGYGPLRVAWDTNILIDYTEYGELMFGDEDFDPPITEAKYRAELMTLSDFMNLWLIRDIRIRIPLRQIGDAKRRLKSKRDYARRHLNSQLQAMRTWQIFEFQSALSCISLDVTIDGQVDYFEPLLEESTNDEWDQSLLEEAIATGCHIFLTNDRKLKNRLAAMARKSGVAILRPSELRSLLAEANELSLAKTGRYLMPDNHKYSHVLKTTRQGFENPDTN
jgi:hypothetical protein